MWKQLFAGLCVAASMATQAMTPQTGTWAVSSELDGKPGRGIALDVQNDTVVVQIYAYESSGQPSFYMGVGTLRSDQVSIPLNRYTGGRYFGSSARSGVAAGTAGTAKFRFTSGVTGFVTFPGESEVAIQRFNFGYPATAASLMGGWSFVSMGSRGIAAEAGILNTLLPSTSSGNGLVASANGRFGCEHQVRGNLAGSVACISITAQGQLSYGYLFVYSVNEGEGYLLDANANIVPDQMVSVRRLTTPAGVGTGIVMKSGEDAKAADPALLRQAMEAVVERAVLP